MTRIRAMAPVISIALLGMLVAAAAATQHLVAANAQRPAARAASLNSRFADAGRIADYQEHADVGVYRLQLRQTAQQQAGQAAQAQAAAKAAADARARAAAAAKAAQAAQQARAAQAAQAPAPAPAPAAPAAPQSIQDIITSAFSPLGPGAVSWALRIASCESTDNPNAVNASTGASGLFQFLRSTWVGTPEASSSIFDPVANAKAAAWLYSTYGPGQWQCS